jgi:hypothetical protein
VYRVAKNECVKNKKEAATIVQNEFKTWKKDRKRKKKKSSTID